MKKRILIVGAPSLSGGGVAHILAEKLSQEAFPLSVEVTNNMPFPVAFPEIGPVMLHQAADLENCKAVVEISGIPAFVRLVTNVEALAEHHQFPEAMYFRLPDVEEEPAAVADKLEGDPPLEDVQPQQVKLPPNPDQATQSEEQGQGDVSDTDPPESPPPTSGDDAGGDASAEEAPPKRVGRPRKNKDAD